MTASTIFAISSGSPPAALGVIRVSGPAASTALVQIVGREVAPRRASLAKLRDSSGNILDEAIVLWFPGPANATGEDCVEFHCHGGRAVLAVVCAALGDLPGLRPAREGEFTRRAFANGRIDLAQAEGFADLLEAETELQRATAIANASGKLSRQVDQWRDKVLHLSAQLEATLDFSDEEDVDELPDGFRQNIDQLRDDIGGFMGRPRSEKLKDGFRIVLAGPPNSGKSTLFNALTESEAAITSAIAGTTRDVIERSVAIHGVPFVFVDTAGLRDDAAEEIEAVGIEKAKVELLRADIVLWLGPEAQGPEGAWEIAARADAADYESKRAAIFSVSGATGQGVFDLKDALVAHAKTALPKAGDAAVNNRQHSILSDASVALADASAEDDMLIIAEGLRRARLAFDKIAGRTTTEDMLDALFGRFCIGK